MSVDQVSAEEAAAIIDVIRENQGSPFVSSTADSLSEGMSFSADKNPTNIYYKDYGWESFEIQAWFAEASLFPHNNCDRLSDLIKRGELLASELMATDAIHAEKITDKLKALRSEYRNAGCPAVKETASREQAEQFSNYRAMVADNTAQGVLYEGLGVVPEGVMQGAQFTLDHIGKTIYITPLPF